MSKLALLLLSEMRVKQWTKNILVYAALIFNGRFFYVKDFLINSAVFFAFCMSASGIYIINDIRDIDKDRHNPKKCNRPLAAGTLGITPALVCSFTDLILGLAIAFAVNVPCFLLLLSYVVLNLLYTFWLKNVVIIDVMIIAYGFVVRAAAGAAATNVEMTAWFLICIMFLSLFLAFGKRRYELIQAGSKTIPEGREVLKYYSLTLIDHMINIVTSAMIMSYALFAMENREMAFTIPIVLYGVFYYMYVVHVKNGGGSPDEELYKELPILMTVIVYVAYVIAARNLY